MKSNFCVKWSSKNERGTLDSNCLFSFSVQPLEAASKSSTNQVSLLSQCVSPAICEPQVNTKIGDFLVRCSLIFSFGFSQLSLSSISLNVHHVLLSTTLHGFSLCSFCILTPPRKTFSTTKFTDQQWTQSAHNVQL